MVSKRKFGGHAGHGPVYPNTHTLQQEALGTVAQAEPFSSQVGMKFYIVGLSFPLAAYLYSSAADKQAEKLYAPEQLIIGKEIIEGKRDGLGQLHKESFVSY